MSPEFNCFFYDNKKSPSIHVSENAHIKCEGILRPLITEAIIYLIRKNLRKHKRKKNNVDRLQRSLPVSTV